MSISFITTVFNEEKSIEELLESLLVQTKKPEQIIIVDAGSDDKTVLIIKSYEPEFKKKNIELRLIIKKGNRSVGRNTAIENAKTDIIVCSDAGCVLDKDWIKNIVRPFSDKSIDVVAGFYKGLPKTIFQKCLIPYVLIMPDKINSSNFLPAARSMTFKKPIWKKVGGFPEQFSLNEDFVFAKKLKKVGAKFVFEKEAIVYWIPRRNFKESFIMFYKFAKGDMQAEILRPKVFLIFLRYLLGLVLLIWNMKLLLILLVLYIVWAIVKNYGYVSEAVAIIILPALQFTSDFAVMLGTIAGFIEIWVTQKM